MSNKLLIVFTVILGSCLSIYGSTIYTVGDTSGWDMSTDLDSWAQKKTFYVGDVLWFAYSSSYSVDKVTKESYDVCNTTNVLQSSSTGNTTFTLTDPGEEYFICGNKLFCLGGMKLHVHVEKAQSETAAPAPQPSAGDGELPPGASRGDDNPSSSAELNGIVGMNGVIMMFLCFFSLVYGFGVI